MVPAGVSIRHPDKLFIGGRWVAPHSGRTIDLISPDTEQVVGRVAEADETDMDAAVAAAREAFDHGPWPTTPPAQRIAVVRKMTELLRARIPEVAKAWTAEVGGLVRYGALMNEVAIVDLDQIADVAETFEFAHRFPNAHGAAEILAYEPVGVVAAIAPWNAPFILMSWKVAPALLAGCTVVMKPSPEAPLEAYIIAEAAEAAGAPPGVINLVTGDRQASDHLVCNPSVDKVNFTGSTAVGKRIASVCGERIARCTLELGGKSAVIVRDDFPISDAAKLLTLFITRMSGQVCAVTSRAIVSRKRHDELADAIADEMRQIKIGYSDDPETQLGPIAMKRQLERVESYIADGKRTADLVCGGERPSYLNRGYFIQPTLFANVDNKIKIAQEEIFGPVMALIPADGDDDAVRIANDSNYGLGGRVLTRDHEAAYRIARQVRTGSFTQNSPTTHSALPRGGFKQSGIGREGWVEGLRAHLELKGIMLEQLPRAL